MLSNPATKYRSFPTITLPTRTWPDRQITQAPSWCSVDLRDGNQALQKPMNVEQKLLFFQMLVEIGFREIEVGFPSASQIEFDFIRKLIDEKLIPDDVRIQVLAPCREALIEKTCQALQGAKKVTVHLYNSISELQRRVVFGSTQEEALSLATQGVKWTKEYSQKYLSESSVQLQYTPESFTGTEIEFARDVCDAVVETWDRSDLPVIINIASTVEMHTPNVFADQVEWMSLNLRNREKLVLSLHCHNDRGTGVACTELGLLAGATRVEGTLFGNGERSGNVDLITLALNLYTQGISPNLRFDDLASIQKTYEECTNMNVHSRHPYVGALVWTAFAGSHQDAINKGLQHLPSDGSKWEVPYLPLDPADIGKERNSVIRLNTQSGKGGVAFVMREYFGLELPKLLQADFAKKVQEHCEKSGEEILPEQLWDVFKQYYLSSLNEKLLSDMTERFHERRFDDARSTAFLSYLLPDQTMEIACCEKQELSDGQTVAYCGARNGHGKFFLSVGMARSAEMAFLHGMVRLLQEMPSLGHA